MSIMIYKGCQGRFEYDADADIFHGEVINLADVITFQGRSIDELKEALADSVEDYLNFCAEKGKTPEKPYSGRFNVRIALEAARGGLSLNSWVARTLAKAVNERRP